MAAVLESASHKINHQILHLPFIKCSRSSPLWTVDIHTTFYYFSFRGTPLMMTAANYLCDHRHSRVRKHFLPKCHHGIQSIPSGQKKMLHQAEMISWQLSGTWLETITAETSGMATAKAGKRDLNLNLDTHACQVSTQQRVENNRKRWPKGFPACPNHWLTLRRPASWWKNGVTSCLTVTHFYCRADLASKPSHTALPIDAADYRSSKNNLCSSSNLMSWGFHPFLCSALPLAVVDQSAGQTRGLPPIKVQEETFTIIQLQIINEPHWEWEFQS